MANAVIRIIGTLMAILGVAGTGFGILGIIVSLEDDPVAAVLIGVPIAVVSLIILGIGLIAAKK